MKKPKNNKAKSKDNDMEQIKWVISAILKMSLYFAQTLEKHNWLSPKCSSKVNRLFKNPKSMLQVLKSNVNGCSKDLQEIFAITKINEMTHEKDDDSFDEDDEDGMILQDLLTAEQKDIAPITFPTSPDEIVIKSPEKSFQCKLIQNSPPTTPSRELIPNPPQKTPPRKLTLNSPPKKVTPKSSPRELSYSKTPSTHSPQELVSQNSLQKLNTKNLLYKSNILPLNLPKKNFNQKTPLHNSPSKSLIHNLIAKNSPQETLDKDRDAAVELKNPLQKIPLVQDNYCLLKSFVRSQEQMSNGHMRSLLINDPQNSSQNRLNEDGEVENKIKEIFSVMIFHERPISPLPSKFENCEDDENILLKHKPNDEVQNKSTAFSTKLKSRGSKRIRPVTKIYCLNKERKLTDETKLKLPDPTRNHLAQYSEDKLSFDEPMDGDDANNSNQLDETEAELPDTTGNHLAQSSEDKMSFDEPMDGDEANNSNQLAEIVLNLGNNDNDLNAKVSQDSDKISPCNDLVKSTGIEESIECVTSANESVEDTSRLKNKEFICKDSPKIKGCISNDFYKTNCSVPSESSEKEVDFELSESAVSLSASILKDYEQRSLGNSVSESNKKSGSPPDLRISEMLLNFRLSKSTKDETVADAPDTDLSILHENSKTSVSIISNRAEVDDCSKTEITTDDDNEVIENLETNSISEDIFDEMQDKILICSPTRIIANTILDEICKTVCANNETISLVPDVPKPPESYNDIICQSDTAVSASEDFLSRALNDDKQLDRFPVVSNNSEKSNGASLAGERSEKTFLPTCVDFDEDNSVFSSPGCDNLVIDEKIECTQKITLFEDSNEIEPHESPIGALAMCLDSDDENSVCNNLVIDARLERTPSLRLSLSSNEMIERTPRLRLFSSSDEIESPESPTAELPLCVDIPEIPLSPQLPRYWTRSRIHENNTKPSPTVNSIRKHFRGKDLSNTGINETILQDASPNCMAFCSPVMTLISPLPSTPVTSAVTCNDSTRVCSMTADESGKYVDPRSSVRRRISLISSPEKLNSQYTTDGIENNSNGIVIEDKSTCQTKAIKRKSEENGMATRKRPKCEVEVKQAAIRNGKSEHRMCTRLSLRIEKMDITNEQVEEKRSNSAQEIKRTLAQEKRKRAQEKGKQAQEAKRKQVQENKMKRIEEAKLKQIEEAKKKQAQEEKKKQAQERKFEAKKNKTQSKNKSRGRRGALQKIVNIEVSAAEKRPLVVPMHLILLIKNGITELKECRLDLTEKFCDNARDRNVSVFTDEEKIFLQRVMDKTKRINNLAKKRALDTLFEYLNAAIFKDSTVHVI
uniref:Uncharacterized protein n=1 Tax=Strigamia maritima TaxID=126957 RepID=T1JJC3_STRMM